MSEKPNTDHYVRSINEVEPNNNGNVNIAVATSHNIFEVFSMLSTETPNGALPLWTGQWINGCNTLFPEFWNRALVLQSAGAIRVVDNATYESELTTYGETGAFVIDTTNHNIRLPKIVNFLRGISDLSSIGTPQGDAIRNLTGKAYPMFDGSTPLEGSESTGSFRRSTGTFSSEINGVYWGVDGENSEKPSTIATGELIFDASNVVPTSDENRPKNISCAMFIQVYNAVGDMSSINVSELVNRVTILENTKLCGIPNYINGTSLSGLSTYTCPVAGVAVMYAGENKSVAINDSIVLYTSYAQGMFIVDAGDVLTHSDTFATDRYNMFYPFK